MKHKTYILSSRLSAEETIARVRDLFGKAGVQYRTEGLSIVSTRTPIALLSFQRILYSDRNWVGLNPFTYISGINVRCRPVRSGLTEIIAQVDRSRTFLWVAYWFCASGLASAGMSTLGDAILFIAVSSAAAWLGLVSFLGGYLMKKKITGCLKA
jgi:hypothetical protein